MASEGRTGDSPHEIVGRRDGVCIKCRGKTFRGARVWWDPITAHVWHVECPPVAAIAAEGFRSPPVSTDLWKRYCKEIADVFAGGNTERKVLEEDRKAYDAGGFGAMLSSLMMRTRCTGGEAVEIVRTWVDTLKAPAQDGKLEAANEKLKAAHV